MKRSLQHWRAFALAFGVACDVRAENLELDEIRAQNEALRAQLQKHADAIQALKDQNAWLREAIEQQPRASDPAVTQERPSVGAADGWQIEGDFLLRHAYYNFDRDARGVEGHSNSPVQYSALLAVSKDLNPSFGATVQFGSASGGPRGLETTLGGGADFDTDPVFINQAYVTWRPTSSNDRLQLALRAGKTPNPFTWDRVTGQGLLPSDLLYWDGTLKPEGAYLTTRYELSESTSLHGVISALVVDANAAAKDPRLYAGQLAALHQLLPDTQLGLRGSWYEWRALDSDFLTRVTGGGNLRSSIDGDEQTRIAEVGAFALWSRNASWPVRLYGSVSRNLAANATLIGSTGIGREDGAWTTGVEIGTPEVLLAGVNYAWIEANAVLASFKDGLATDGFTNRREWHFYAARRVVPGVTLAVDAFLSDPIKTTGALSGCVAGGCGPFETSISNAERTFVMTNLIFDF